VNLTITGSSFGSRDAIVFVGLGKCSRVVHDVVTPQTTLRCLMAVDRGDGLLVQVLQSNVRGFRTRSIAQWSSALARGNFLRPLRQCLSRNVQPVIHAVSFPCVAVPDVFICRYPGYWNRMLRLHR
jgi:hypothetical protein